MCNSLTFKSRCFSSKIYVGPLFPIRWTREVIKFCSYFVEHRETSELGSGIILARPSYPIHLLAVYAALFVD